MRAIKIFENSIRTTWKNINAWRAGKTVIQFDMSTISITTPDQQISLENNEFEIIMAEYIRRNKELKKLNRRT